MSILISKIIYHHDNPDCYVEMDLDVDKPYDFAFVAGEVQSLFPKNFDPSKPKIRNVDHSLFNSSQLTRIVVPVTPQGLYYLKLRPKHILEQLIVEPDDIVVDIYYSDDSLIYSFYNPSRRESIVVRAKLVEDRDDIYTKLKSNAKDLTYRQNLLYHALGKARNVSPSTSPTDIPDILDIEEASKYLRISKSTLYKKTSGKIIPHYKNGKNLLFHKSDLDNYIEDNKVRNMNEINDTAVKMATNINFKRRMKK